LVRQVNLDRMVRTEKMDHKVYKDFPGPWDPLETRGLWVNKVDKETLELLDSRDPEETLARTVFLATLGLLDHPGPLESVVRPVPLDPEASRVCQDLQERTGWQVEMVRQDFKALRE